MLRRALILALALVFAVAPAIAAQSYRNWDASWVESSYGGSQIEVPSFLMAGETHDITGDGIEGTSYDGVNDFPFTLQQYRVPGMGGRPHQFLVNITAGKLVTVSYSLDHANLGVVTGYEDAAQRHAYYGICRPAPGEMQCLGASWDAAVQTAVDPIINRLVKSFKMNLMAPAAPLEPALVAPDVPSLSPPATGPSPMHGQGAGIAR